MGSSSLQMSDIASFHNVLCREELALSFAHGFSEFLDHFKGISIPVGAHYINSRGHTLKRQREFADTKVLKGIHLPAPSLIAKLHPQYQPGLPRPSSQLRISISRDFGEGPSATYSHQNTTPVLVWAELVPSMPQPQFLPSHSTVLDLAFRQGNRGLGSP